MRYSNLPKNFRCVKLRVDSFVVGTLRNDSYGSVYRSYLNVNQSLQFNYAFIRLVISDSISYNLCNYSLHFANNRKDSSWDLPRSLNIQTW